MSVFLNNGRIVHQGRLSPLFPDMAGPSWKQSRTVSGQSARSAGDALNAMFTLSVSQRLDRGGELRLENCQGQFEQ